MTYLAKYGIFIEDKHDFIKPGVTFDHVDARVIKTDYRFLSQNKSLIEQEFHQLFSSLQKQDKNREEFWNYCYYCCRMLEAYYQAYDDSGKVKQYQRFAQQIHDYCKTGRIKAEQVKPRSFIATLGNQIMAEFSELANTPQHLSKIRSKIGMLNVYRIYWAFLRMTLSSSFLLARDIGWINKLNRLLGKKIDVDKIIKSLEKPSEVFRAMSVGFFVSRFLLNAAMLVKHTFFPSGADKSLSRYERFCFEIKKRHPDFLNDIVWGTINGVSNYAPFLHIAAPVAGWLTGGFLFFDVCLLLWRRRLAEREYSTKKAQYRADLSFYEEMREKSENKDERKLAFRQCQILKKQISELEITWQVKSATFLFNATAALILATCFSAAMLFAPGVMPVAAYAVCVLAVAMYLSDAEYSKYKESKLRLHEAKLNDENIVNALKEYRAARYEFAYTLAKNAIVPALVIAAYAICWQAALVLTAAFLAYELWMAYNRYKAKQAAILPANDEGDVLEQDDADSELDETSSLLPSSNRL